jgi:outer membrane protein TolC
MKHKISVFAILVFYIFSLVPQTGYSEQKLSLTLEQCIRAAARNSFEVKLARLDFLIAETDLGVEESIFDTLISIDVNYEEDKREPLSIFGADHSQTNVYSIEATKTLPSGTELTLSFDDTRNWSNSAYSTRNPAHTAEASVELRQPVAKNFFGYVDRRNISVTSLAIQNSGLDTQDRIESLLADVEEAYWEWAFSLRNLETFREILQRAEDLHRNNLDSYDIGRIEKGDLLASEANVLIRKRDVLLAENRYRRAEEKIKLLMNMNSSGRIYLEQGLEYKEIEVALDDCLKQAFQKRRDYRKAKRDVEIKNISLETKANERWPEIDLVASLAANGVSSGFRNAAKEITSEDQQKYYAGIEISLPVENREANSEFTKAGHNKKKAILTLKSIERTILTEIGDAFRDYRTYESNLDNLIQAGWLQQDKLKEEEKQFRFGRSDTKTVIDYQQDYLRSQLAIALGMLELERARINLEKATNTILEKYEGMI